MRRRLRPAVEWVLTVLALIVVVPFLAFALVANRIIEWFEQRDSGDDETVPPRS